MVGPLSEARAMEVLSESPDLPMQFPADAKPIEVAVYLAASNYSMAIVERGGGYYVIGGYNVLELILRSGEGAWRALYTTSAADIAWPALTLAPGDPVIKVLGSVEGSGHILNAAVVDEGWKVIGIITALDLARFSYARGVLRSAPLKGIGSPAISIPPEASLRDAISTMIERKVRRLVVRGLDRPAVVSDRGIMRGALSGGLLAQLRDDPSGTLGRPISSFQYMMDRPALIGGGVDAHRALEEVLASTSNCAITDDGRIVTPMDLVLLAFGSR